MLIKAPSIISVAFFIMTIHMSIFRFRLWTQNDVCIVNKYLFKYVSSHSFHIILTHISQSLIEITNTTNALRACDHWPGPGSSQHWPVTRSRLVSGPRLPDIWPSPPQLPSSLCSPDNADTEWTPSTSFFNSLSPVSGALVASSAPAPGIWWSQLSPHPDTRTSVHHSHHRHNPGYWPGKWAASRWLYLEF